MPTVQQLPEKNVELAPDKEEPFAMMLSSILSRYPQITPAPLGPESVELSRIIENVRRSLEQLETMRPYLGNVHEPFLAFLERSRESGEASFDYDRLPPTRTVSMGTRFFVRGRGKPKPYALEDD